MRFLLIDPFIDKNVVKSIFAMESQLPSLGLLYIGSVLEKEGHDVDLIDFCAEKFTEEKLKKKLKDTDVVGITVRTHGLKSVMKLCRIIKKLKPEITIIIGGPHCTLEPIKALKDTKADILVEGDGEFVIKEITKALQNKKPLDNIPGVHFWEKNKIKNGPPAKIIMDLDKIPFPARHLVKKYKYGYFEGGFSLNKGLVTSLTISRGCPYHCRFCVDNAITKKYRARSPENIIEEIRQIEKDYDFIYIMDDNFFVDVKKTERFLDLLIKERFNLKFSAAGIRIDMANKRLFKKMKYYRSWKFCVIDW